MGGIKYAIKYMHLQAVYYTPKSRDLQKQQQQQ